MKTLILFDSYFGNTEQVARTIGQQFENEQSKTMHISEVKSEDMDEVNLLIIGSPTRGFRPTENVSTFIKGKLTNDLKGVDVAVFDTRIALETIKSKAFRFLVNTGGYAASTMAKQLIKKRATLMAPPEGFLVTGEQGPLKEGEIERATEWGKKIAG